MAQASYFPTMDGFGDEVGDAANPLSRLIHKNRHSHPPVRFREAPPLDEIRRRSLLRKHCTKHSGTRHHEFLVQTRNGRACLWCGIERGEERF